MSLKPYQDLTPESKYTPARQVPFIGGGAGEESPVVRMGLPRASLDLPGSNEDCGKDPNYSGTVHFMKEKE